MWISPEEALSLLEGSSKYEHSLIVSRIMKKLAEHFNASVELWSIIGLLHDLDYDNVSDFSKHGIKAADELDGLLPIEALHAIRAHDIRTGVKPVGLLDEALIFADSLAVYLEARPSLDSERTGFSERPWLREILVDFTVKHELDVSELLLQLTV